jgi:hypothetical protein
MASIHKRTTTTGDTRWDVRYRDPDHCDRSRSFRRKADGVASRWLGGIMTTQVARSELRGGIESVLGPRPSVSAQGT